MKRLSAFGRFSGSCKSGKQNRLSLLLSLLVWIVLFSPIAAAPSQKIPVTVGALANNGLAECHEKWDPTVVYLNQKIPSHSFTLVELGFDEVIEAVRNKQVDYVITHSSMFIELEHYYHASALATMKEFSQTKGVDSYASLIFTKAGNDEINNLKDIKGKRFYAVEDNSFAGWQMALRELKSEGIDGPRDFSELVFVGTHDAVIEAVLDGRADAGTIRTSMIEAWIKSGKISLEDIKIINPQPRTVEFPWYHSTRRYPNWPFVTFPGNPRMLSQDIAAALISMSRNDPAAEAAGLTGWTIPQSYQSVHDIMQELRLGIYEDYGKISYMSLLEQFKWWILATCALLLTLIWLLQYVSKLNRKLHKAAIEIKASEQRYRQLYERYERINENLSLGVSLIEPDMTVLVANRQMRQWFPEVMSQEKVRCFEAFHGSNFGDICKECLVKKCFEDGQIHQFERVVEIDTKDKYLSITAIPIKDEQGKVSAALEIVEDVTEKRLQEMSLADSEKRQRLLADISSDFIAVNLNNLDVTIRLMLQKAGEFFGVEQGFLLDVSNDKVQLKHPYQWVAISAKDAMQVNEGPVRVLKWWIRQIEKEGVVCLNSLDELPEEAVAERSLFELRKVKTMISVPVRTEHVLRGILGMNTFAKSKVWDQKDIVLLQVLGNIISDALIKTDSERKLIEAKEQAEAASKAKSQFLANMSHELRTPLNGVIGFTDLLRDTPLSTQQKIYLDNAYNSASSLLEVISEILDFSKIEAGKLVLEPVKTDIPELMESCVDVVVYQASRKHLEIIINLAADIPRFAVVDPVRLKQVLINLLSNAVKFTHKGEVELRVSARMISEARAVYSITVRDTGIGIEPEQQEQLFQAFYQGDSSTTRKYGGTGLGLVISKYLVEEMGGKITLESSPGEGTSFSFELELDSEHAPNGRYRELKHIQSVLVVDDNSNNRMILEDSLRRWGLDVDSCEGAEEAVQIYTGGKDYGLLIVDYHMPDYDGLQTIRILRNSRISSKLPPVILYSSADDVIEKDEMVNLGIRYQLIKPVKTRELLSYLYTLDETYFVTAQTAAEERLLSEKKTVLLGDKTILIAEDNRTNLALAKILLRKCCPAATILEAQNGKQALDIALGRDLDVILMDVQMPEMDGLEATQRIRQAEQITGRHVPIVALTAGALTEERDKCYQAGMDDFLSKPIDKERLESVLSKLLGASKAPTTTLEEPIQDSSESSFDKASLLARINNDEALMQELINIFLEQMPLQLRDLEQAVLYGDLDKIKKAAHGIKGSALNMGLGGLGELARLLESSTPEAATKLMQSVELEWERARKLLLMEVPEGRA